MSRLDKKIKIKELFLIYGTKCFYCRSNLLSIEDYSKLSFQLKKKYRVATLEHLIPSSFGGSNHTYNLRLACCSCNSSRNDGWKKDEVITLVNCPLLIKLESKAKYRIKLSFFERPVWCKNWEKINGKLVYKANKN